MEKSRNSLQGKKTYLATIIGALYLLGVWAGFWEWDEKILAAFGLGALAFLRSAVTRHGISLVALSLILFASGCARFSTTQKDYSYDAATGKLTRKIYTRAAGQTLIEAKSNLATWSASQTDKVQGAKVGGLALSADSTNTLTGTVGVLESAARLARELKSPLPLPLPAAK